MSNKPSHSFDPVLAEKYGLAEAVFLTDVFFWVEHNKAHKKNFKDGKYWTYNTNKAICERHPYWSRGQVDRIIKKLSDSSAILIGHYNKDPRDRTNWYTFGDELFEYFFGDSPCEKGIDAMQETDETESTKSGNESQKIVEPLPYSYPDCIYPDTYIPPNPQKGETGKSAVHVPSKEETGFSDGLQEAFEEWIQYKAELKFKYTKTSLSSLVKRLRKSSDQYGEAAVISMLQDTMSSGYKGPVWDWLIKNKSQRQETPQSREEYENKWKEAIKIYGIQEF